MSSWPLVEEYLRKHTGSLQDEKKVEFWSCFPVASLCHHQLSVVHTLILTVKGDSLIG